MRKFTGGLIGLAFLLCAFTAQASEPEDVFGVSSEPMAMTIVICSSNSDCAPGAECLSAKVCVDDITSMPTSASCTTDDDCDVGSSCQETSICVDDGGCFSDADCAGNPDGEICNLTTGQCVECIADSDCSEGAFCERSACVLFEDCDLSIRPTTIKISGRPKRPFVLQLIRIRGNENFDPRGTRNACTSDNDCASGETCAANQCAIAVVFDQSFVQDPNFVPNFPPGIEEIKNSVSADLRNKQVGKKRLRFVIAAGTELFPGPVPLRIGKCPGEIELQ